MHQPKDSAPVLDLTFPHEWQATVPLHRPLIAPASFTSMRHFVYPREVEEIERGALELIVRPSRRSRIPCHLRPRLRRPRGPNRNLDLP